jgi:hypothetical protein
MTDDAALDALLALRELFDGGRRCKACKGVGYVGKFRERTACPDCRGEGHFRPEGDVADALLALAAFQRRLLADMADDGRAVAVMRRLREENEFLKERVDLFAESKRKAEAAAERAGAVSAGLRQDLEYERRRRKAEGRQGPHRIE